MTDQDYANLGRWVICLADSGVVFTVFKLNAGFQCQCPHDKRVVGRGASVGEAVHAFLVGLRDLGVIDG